MVRFGKLLRIEVLVNLCRPRAGILKPIGISHVLIMFLITSVGQIPVEYFHCEVQVLQKPSRFHGAPHMGSY